MVALYTSTGEYVMRRNSDGLRYPVIMLGGKEYHLSVPEMILWTKGMWNICTQDLLRDSFKQEEKVLGDMNFSFILDRLLQRGLMLSGEANSDIEALHTLIDKKIVYAADVSLPSQVKMFFIMVIMMGVPVKHAKTVFKNYDLTAVERYALDLAKDKSMTTIELIHNLNLDDMSALMLISNLYLRKLIRFSEHKRGVCL